MERKVVQYAAVHCFDECEPRIYAFCDDGTAFFTWPNNAAWHPMNLPPIPQPAPQPELVKTEYIDNILDKQLIKREWFNDGRCTDTVL